MSTKVTIPRQLTDEILKGNVVLFLGAGASHGALHPRGAQVPLGNHLKTLLVEKFLDSSYAAESLAHVAEVCMNESDLFTVQDYVKNIFNDFSPAPHHLIIPQFKWKAIFTTNYDLIIEKAYETDRKRLQNLNVVVQNSPIEKIFSDKTNVLYFKMHGCIRYINDLELPLVLSLDQYSSVHKKRDRLFSKLQELASDYTFIFVGFSNSDPDIRDVLKKLEELNLGRPRSYFVAPTIRPEEIRMLDQKKITAIPVGFNDFMEALDVEISVSNRQLSALFTNEVQHPIYRKFVNDPKTQPVTNAFIQFINTQVDFIHSALTSDHTNEKEFYKGYFVNWDPIIKNLDINRNITDTIILKAFLDEGREARTQQQLHIIKGNAGSGKTVLLKRIAWKAAVEHDKLCLVYKTNTPILYESIYETYRLCNERLYLFVDNTIHYTDYIIHILNKAKKDLLPLTIIGCVRNNEYNIHNTEYNEDGEELSRYLTEAYELTYLDDKEIRELIAKLDRHKSLGHLEGKPFEDQVDAFSKQFGRELLVALYEATEGKSFAEIITDEYKGISSPEAQSLYLTVSILHRLGCKARAGFISRMHSISLTDFKDRLFAPLEHIVFDTYNNFIGDFEYSTRHQQIAEMIFNNILQSEQDRFDEYLRIVSFLDVDYENDRTAFRAIINAKKLKDIFRNNSMKRDLYNAARTRTTNDSYLLQQMGIFEMSIGNKKAAYGLLNEAKDINKNDYTILHSLAEYEYKLAIEANNNLEKDSHLNKAVDICNKALKKEPNNSSFYHTLIKVGLIKLNDLLIGGDPVSIERQIKDTQSLLSLSLQNCGEDQFLLDADSKFHLLIKDSPTALLSLEKAFSVNKRSPYIALRLSRFYENDGQIDKAISVLSETLKVDPFQKEINHKLGLLYFKIDPKILGNALYHLKRGFTPNDSNHLFQYDYARLLFLDNQVEHSKELFDLLHDTPISIIYKRTPKDFYKINNQLVLFTGTISRISLDYGYIKVDGTGSTIFTRIKKKGALRMNDRVNFNLGFNYYGPLALNVKLI